MNWPLKRFLDAQSHCYESALKELNRGQKTGHWMWFIFPQLKGLGRSNDSWFYGLSNIDEADAYLNHPILGSRLLKCTHVVLKHKSKSVDRVFGSPDNLKFASCMTLFSLVPGSPSEFSNAIELFFSGNYDKKTIELLRKDPNEHV